MPTIDSVHAIRGIFDHCVAQEKYIDSPRKSRSSVKKRCEEIEVRTPLARTATDW